ncbi:MAG TPA: lanthionine synthetase LanC family protein, partial [Kofleriaceae bacterium]|nr:lanthionine synthetase LanC family protein [Kofleriaceae bacterium]
GAARALGSPAWEERALAIARRAAARPDGECGVVDAGLCHGAAGLAHVFNRLHQASGDPALAAAAERWFGRALAMDAPAEPGILVGSAGLALALLAATGEDEPDWDGFLLLAQPG